MIMTAELKTLIECSDKLITALSLEPLYIATELFARGIISQIIMDKMLVLGITDRQKAVELVTVVRNAVELNSQNFHTFVEILKYEVSRKDIVDILTAAYQHNVKQLEEESVRQRKRPNEGSRTVSDDGGIIPNRPHNQDGPRPYFLRTCILSVCMIGLISMGIVLTYHQWKSAIVISGDSGTGDKASFTNFPHMNERPTMNQLAILERGDGGNPVRISERIGVKYSDVGTYLLKDDHGRKMETVADNARGNVDTINREIFRRWLAGSGAPVSWKVLVDTLERAQLIALANDIVDALNT